MKKLVKLPKKLTKAITKAAHKKPVSKKHTLK